MKSREAAIEAKKHWEAFFKSSLKQEWIKALVALDALKKLEPENSQVYLKAGDILQKTNKTPEAIAAYHQSAWCLINSGFRQKALAIFKIIQRLSPSDIEARQKTDQILKELENERHSSGFVLAPRMPVEPPPQVQQTPAKAPAWPVASEAPNHLPSEEAPQAESSAPSDDASWPSAAPDTSWPTLDSTPEPEAAIEGPTPAGWHSASFEESTSSTLAPLDEQFKQPKDICTIADSTVPSAFSSLSASQWGQLSSRASKKFYRDGQDVVVEGDAGESMFIIQCGKAAVITNLAGRTFELATLSEGEIFGEIAFLTGRPRTATVRASGALEVLEFDRDVIQPVIAANHELTDKLAAYYMSRIESTMKTVKTSLRK